MAIRWWTNFDDTFIHFDSMYERDGQTDTHTQRDRHTPHDSIGRACIASRGKNHQNTMRFDKVIVKIKRVQFLASQCITIGRQQYRVYEKCRSYVGSITDSYIAVGPLIVLYILCLNKKLSCRRETARRFVSLNILLSHSQSLKVIRNDTVV